MPRIMCDPHPGWPGVPFDATPDEAVDEILSHERYLQRNYPKSMCSFAEYRSNGDRIVALKGEREQWHLTGAYPGPRTGLRYYVYQLGPNGTMRILKSTDFSRRLR